MMAEGFVDYFQWLEVHFTASDEVIKAAYRKLSAKYHPDNHGNQWQLIRVNEAYEVLSDPSKKKAYMTKYAAAFDQTGVLKGAGYQKSMMDFSVSPVRQILLQYLYLIQQKEFEEAYRVLSQYNRKHMFKKDFIQWQRLTSGIHELLSFDCTFVEGGTIQFSDDKYLLDRKYMKFRVKVTEYNHLMKKEDEDYFDRVMILDEEGWHVLLMQRQIKSVIKRYKDLTQAHKRSMVTAGKKSREHLYATGYVSPKSFLNNCEHEQLRFMRYGSVFSLLSFNVDGDKGVEELKILLETNTRVLDSITYLKRGILLVLLPETNGTEGELALSKLMTVADSKGYGALIRRMQCHEQRFQSVKELLNEVTL